MDAYNLKKQFDYRKMMDENRLLKNKLSAAYLDISNITKQQDNIINKKVKIKTKEIIEKFKEEMNNLEKKYMDNLLEKDKQIEVLKKEVAKLASRLDNDASNSGIPSSKTPIGKKKYVPNTREKSNKKIGGQVGHKKHKLEKFKDEEITEVVEVTPDVCPKCNSSDIKTLDTAVTKHETDYDVKLIKREYKFSDCKCNKCNNSFRSKIPNDLKEDNQYGKTVQSLAICLTNEIYTPFNKVVKLVTGITKNEINMSEGYVVKLQKKGSDFLDKFLSDCKNHIIDSKVFGWDDSVITVDKKQACLRIYATENVSLFVAHKQKNKEGLDTDGILLNATDDTTVMHDNLLLNYNEEYRFENVECLIHLIRRLKKSHEETKHEWQLELKSLLSKANKDRNELIGKDVDCFDKKYLNGFMKEYDDILVRATEENDNDTDNYWFKEEIGFIKNLTKLKKSYTLWLTNFKLPSTNNNCERNLRPIKSKLKISGQFQSLTYAEYHAKLRSYIETCKRNGINIIDACERLMHGNPYTLTEVLNYKKEEQ
jgi:predicted HicB family RNase H-like nuclease